MRLESESLPKVKVQEVVPDPPREKSGLVEREKSEFLCFQNKGFGVFAASKYHQALGGGWRKLEVTMVPNGLTLEPLCGYNGF